MVSRDNRTFTAESAAEFVEASRQWYGFDNAYRLTKCVFLHPEPVE